MKSNQPEHRLRKQKQSTENPTKSPNEKFLDVNLICSVSSRFRIEGLAVRFMNI